MLIDLVYAQPLSSCFSSDFLRLGALDCPPPATLCAQTSAIDVLERFCASWLARLGRPDVPGIDYGRQNAVFFNVNCHTNAFLGYCA